MTDKQRLNLLNKLEELNQIPAINRGGCAVAAYAIKKYLKIQGIKSNIIYLLDYEPDYIELSNGNAEACAHAIIEVEGVWYDSSGPLNKKDIIRKCEAEEPYGIFNISRHLVKKSIKGAVWNPSFDKECYLPKIANIFNINLRNLA